ncbi:MAG: HAMP domain-containing histidine kinase [Desulfosarcina sp.]|nr:HAMP domain-containing histidine kinase [Desulfosarcina sp.]MBC2745366.1 HAMP domain-containing histidine kinase [Desulfosarcina sp.]MBC2768271.1 HAMP domain-containing histidine kinase [Desulfosarcina sp.]
MKTYFAPAQRLDREALDDDITAAIANPVIDGLLNTVSGLLAVLNEHRQILAINDTFLEMLSIDDADHALGLRPGEVIGCIHRDVNEGGCGTSPFCATCGAAIAIVTCLHQDGAIEKDCAVVVDQKGMKRDLFLRVRACPISVDGRRMILLFLQDITRQQQWEALGRVFFHDLSNIIYGLVGSSEILLDKTTDENREAAQRIHRLSLRLAREVQMQRHLTEMTDADYRLVIQPITVERIFHELNTAFASHPAARQRTIIFADQHLALSFKSDFFLVVRVITNMVTNALEATDKGRSIKVWALSEDQRLSFYVWNHQAISGNVVDRIFQRNISTKADSGRGLGTYSMKLFGETFLNGKVDFITSEAEGTTFCFSLPLSPLDRGSGILPREY